MKRKGRAASTPVVKPPPQEVNTVSIIPEGVPIQGHTPPPLSEQHRRVLEEGSAISPDVVAESGARTISRGRELPHTFSARQRRRAPGILFPLHRPNGAQSWAFRPDRVDPERPGHKYEQPCKALGAPGNTLGILPSQRPLIADTDVPVVFVEGSKKQLSLISAFRRAAAPGAPLVVAIIGTWNWLHSPNGVSIPIDDMADIPVSGRKVTIMFDSDMLTKWQVQLAAHRLAEHLISRGAAVHVTFFHHLPDGSKCGADDFSANGGTLEELRLLTRRYDPSGADFTRIRLDRDERLRAMLEDLRHRYEEMPAAKIGECSDRATMRELLRRAEQHGEVTGRGIVVRAPSRPLANRTRMSQPSQIKSLRRLERDGYLERIEEPKRKIEEKGAAYLLKPSTAGLVRAQSYQYGKGGPQPNNAGEETENGGQEHAQRSPDGNAELYAGDNSARASDQVPELRHSKVVHTWEYAENRRRVVVDSEYIYRLGKPRQELVMWLLDNGGEADEEELLERFGSRSTRLRDFRRRRIAPVLGHRYTRDKVTGAEIRIEIGPPIVECSNSGMVRLLPEWREALEEHRRKTGELGDNERQEERYRRQSEAYRNRDRTPASEQTSPLRGKEEVARLVEERRKEERARWIEEQRQKVGETAATFLADEMADVIGVRFRDARERWVRRGGRVEDLRLAVLYGPFLFQRVAADLGEIYVYHEDGRTSDAYDRKVEETCRRLAQPPRSEWVEADA